MWLLVLAVVVGSFFGSVWALRLRIGSPRVDGDTETESDAVTLAASEGWVQTSAIVAGLRQDGVSRGMVIHRCRVDLMVDLPGTGTDPVEMTVEMDLGVEQLACWLPGTVVDVLVDADPPTACRPLLAATRTRATGRTSLPATSVRGIPDAHFLKPEERRLAASRATTAVIGAIRARSPSTGTTCSVTLGLWVDDEYATTVVDRFTLDQVIALPRGDMVAVAVDEADRMRVVVDIDDAIGRLAGRLPSADTLSRAVSALGETGRVGIVTSIRSGRGERGVRYEWVGAVDPVDGGGTVQLRLMLAVPDAAPIVRGSAVVLDAAGTSVDLDATSRARVHAAAAAR